MYTKHEKSYATFPWYIIWGSSFLIGILASVPKILRSQSTQFPLLYVAPPEILSDFLIALIVSLLIWWINEVMLQRDGPYSSILARLVASIGIGFLGMTFAYSIFSNVFPDYNASVIFWVFQFRGLIFNLVILTIIYSLMQLNKARMYGLETEQLRSENLAAQLIHLKQQLNPHFFFNSLNILKSMVETKDKDAPEMIMKLSEFYRYALLYKDQNRIRLKEELQILDAYFYALKARFEEGFIIKKELSVQAINSHIPPFTLQILVENAIKHNSLSVKRPLIIELRSEHNLLVIRNNIQKKRGPGTSTGIGLENIKQRYYLLGKKSIAITTDEYFTVKLPLLFNDRKSD